MHNLTTLTPVLAGSMRRLGTTSAIWLQVLFRSRLEMIRVKFETKDEPAAATLSKHLFDLVANCKQYVKSH